MWHKVDAVDMSMCERNVLEVGEVDVSNLVYLHRDAVRGWRG